MSTDIHYILEKRTGNQWKYVSDKLPALDNAGYGVYAIISGVRDSFGQRIFDIKGLPNDISGTKFRFESEVPFYHELWESEGTCLVLPSILPIPMFQAHSEGYDLKTPISEEFYNEFEKKNPDPSRYQCSGWSCSGGHKDYFLYDAQKVGGKFEKHKNSECYVTFEDFVQKRFFDDWDEDAQDYGRWKVDFECEDYHSHSYLTLEELISADYTRALSHVYKMDQEFYKAFTEAGGVLPDRFHIEKSADGDLADCFREALCPTVSVVWTRTEDEMKETQIFKVIEEMKGLSEKYGVSPDDFRIIFAFDN